MYSPGTGDRTKQNADTRVTYKTKMITHLRNPLQGCSLDDTFPRVERCAFNPGLCDDTLSEGIQNGDARAARFYGTYCYSITYLFISVSIRGSFHTICVFFNLQRAMFFGKNRIAWAAVRP